MAQVPYLTTVDNPYDPRDEFREWYALDRWYGYDTVGLLARVEKNSDGLSPADQDLIREQAINEIAEFNVSGMHRIVYKTEP